MKTNVLSRIRQAKAETERASSIRAQAQQEAEAAQKRAEQAALKFRRFLTQELPTTVGFNSANELIAALQEAINTPETNQPLTTTPPVKTRKNARKAVTRKVVSTTTKPPMPIAIPTGRKNTNLTKELMKEVKRLNKAGYTDAQIGTSLGIKPATAKYARLKLGLRGHPGNPGSRKKTSATPASTIDNTPATETTALTTT